MAEKAAIGSEFASWTSLPPGPLGEALSAAKNMAIGYGIQESGLRDWLNNTFGKKEQLPDDYTPSGGMMPTPDYGMQAPMQEGVKPPSMSSAIQPPSMSDDSNKSYKPTGLPNAMTSMNSTSQPVSSSSQMLGKPIGPPSPFISWENSAWNPQMRNLGEQLLISAGADFKHRSQNEGYRPYDDTIFTPKQTPAPSLDDQVKNAWGWKPNI